MNKFFKSCIGAALILSCTAVAVCACGSKTAAPAPKTIGIQLYSVLKAVIANPRESVEKLTEMGYNTFELVQWGGDPKVFGLPAEEFKAICDSCGATILSTHSSLQEDPENEEENLNNWRALFAVQKALGGKYFVIPSYKVDYTTEGVKQMADYFNRVGKIAWDEFGLKLGYHNHSGEFQPLEDSEQPMWEYLVENTDPNYVMFELDVYWCTKGGKDPVEYLKKYPERIQMLHVKDELVIGDSGEIDFEGIFNQFYTNGMSDYVVEIETPRSLREKTNADGSAYTEEQIMDEMFEAARKSAEYLQNAPFVK